MPYAVERTAVENTKCLTAPASDPTDRWQTASPRVDHFRGDGGVIGGKLYVAGGEHFNSSGPFVTRKLEVYDPVTNTWSFGAVTARARFRPRGIELRARRKVGYQCGWAVRFQLRADAVAAFTPEASLRRHRLMAS